MNKTLQILLSLFIFLHLQQPVRAETQQKMRANPQILLSQDFWKNVQLKELKRILKHTKKIPEIRTAGGWSPLMMATYFSNDIDIVKYLVSKGENINARDLEGWTPLIIASMRRKNPEFPLFYIKKGSNINAKDVNGKTAYYYINKNPLLRNSQAFLILNKNEISKSKKKSIPLESISAQMQFFTKTFWKKADKDAIETLQDQGADINILDSKGRNPLLYALENSDNTDGILDILDLGANVNAVDYTGKNAVSYSAKYSKNKKIITEILKKGGRSIIDESGYSPFMYALKNKKKLDILKLFIDKNTINSINNNGETALIMAAKLSKDSRVIRALLNGGAKPNIRSTSGASVMDYMKDNPYFNRKPIFYYTNQKRFDD